MLMLLLCIAMAFIAHRYVEAIEERLPNCSYITDIRHVWSNAGLLGKIMRGSIIATVLIMPNIHEKRGLIDIREVDNLPKRYKKLLIIPLASGYALTICLIALRIASHFLER
ncbi:hypothetical protein [Pseudomonas syringae]|nr:hypothetical protein [Pseudomonas syringae]